jgi:hypothetical protein
MARAANTSLIKLIPPVNRDRNKNCEAARKNSRDRPANAASSPAR